MQSRHKTSPIAMSAISAAVVPEDVYDKMIHSYLSCPKKTNWKYHLKTPEGAKVKVQYDERRFMFSKGSQKFMLIGDESAQTKGLNAHHPGHESFAAEVEENKTGKHKSKPWHIRVPTKPSEPVRA